MAFPREYAPHEGLFYKVFRDPENTKYFLRQHLSPEIQRSIDLDSLRLENVCYVDDNLRKHFSDLVFSLMLRGEEFPSARIYLLFEHKSAPEPLVGMQILRYMALQWKDLYDQYLTKASGVLDQDDFQKALSYLPEGGEKIMDTLANQWIEQGKDEGRTEGITLGEQRATREMLLEAISEKFGIVSPDLLRRINSIESHESLKMLFKQTFRLDSLDEFKEQVHRATDN